MKWSKAKRVALAAAISALPLAGCGANSGGSTNPGSVYQPLPGYTPIVTNPGTISGCVPINQPISFTLSGVYLSWVNIVGGVIPGSNQTVGQITLQSAAATTVPALTGQNIMARQGVDGLIQLNLSAQTGITNPLPTGYPVYTSYSGYYPSVTNPYNQAPSAASGTGYIQLSQATIADIIYQTQSGLNGFPTIYSGTSTSLLPTTTGTIPCVSGIAIDGGHYRLPGQTYETIYGATVYLYLNNTQHGYKLYF